jgi:hypothetical protein
LIKLYDYYTRISKEGSRVVLMQKCNSSMW